MSDRRFISKIEKMLKNLGVVYEYNGEGDFLVVPPLEGNSAYVVVRLSTDASDRRIVSVIAPVLTDMEVGPRKLKKVLETVNGLNQLESVGRWVFYPGDDEGEGAIHLECMLLADYIVQDEFYFALINVLTTADADDDELLAALGTGELGLSAD